MFQGGGGGRNWILFFNMIHNNKIFDCGMIISSALVKAIRMINMFSNLVAIN